ncbi:unnamed protein product [Phytophthora fragariaefolia]|uniref:Unnamed protein product n=1 Tax=Phytophthora fragariaefolia TaxID=1490495 RepID=A0A9W6XM18_9STRA|nr:unnamed protein product [Phytophthora fragariaefolia]
MAEALCGGGCGQLVGGVHKCPSCHSHMHPFCGRPIGEEGFGLPVLCPRCDTAQPLDKAISASPIIAAFDRARALSAAQREGPQVGNDSDGDDSATKDSYADYEQSGFLSNTGTITDIVTTTSRWRCPNSVRYVHHRLKVVVWMRDFTSGKLNEDTVENMDETNFVIDFADDKTLGLVGQKQIKYADVVSGGEGMTMVVRISGGANARVHPPMMIFTNSNCSYPIHGIPDSMPGVSYRSSPKGWMNTKNFREYLQEPRAMCSDWMGREKTIFLDNCSGHLGQEDCKEELDGLNADLRYLPPNATDLCQPVDSFVIAKIKDIWSRKWNAKKIELIEKRIDGTWKVRQLFPHLQEIVRKFPEHFAGKRASTSVKYTADEGTSVDKSPNLEDVAEYTSLQSADVSDKCEEAIEEALV